MSIEEVWDTLRAVPSLGDGIVRRRVREDSARNLFVGVVQPTGEKALLLVVARDALGAFEPFSSRSIRSTVADAGVADQAEIRVVLTSSEMERVFAPFCEDVIETVAAARDDVEAVQLLAERFLYWRRLLAAEAIGLTPALAQGLYGELWALRHLVEPAVSGRAPASWHGPDRELRDFLVGGIGLEVKTTIGEMPVGVRISSERQLDLTGLTSLYLVALTLTMSTGGAGESLVAAVVRTRNLFQGPERLVLEDKLLSYGYLDADAGRYGTIHYSVRAALGYRVSPGFPRIAEEDLMNGVGGVSYTVALSACEPWLLALPAITSALAGALEGAPDS